MDREQIEKTLAMAMAEEHNRRQQNYAGTANECASQPAETERRPGIHDDPRGWAHDICAHHAPSKDGIERITAIRAAAEAFIVEILRSCPDCQDRLVAIGNVRYAMMFANGSIALDGRI